MATSLQLHHDLGAKKGEKKQVRVKNYVKKGRIQGVHYVFQTKNVLGRNSLT